MDFYLLGELTINGMLVGLMYALVALGFFFGGMML